MSRRALGLRQGAVVVREYDTRWPREYERERAILTELLEGVVDRIEHVGSTAVPGLAAKPLIDIALGFADRALLDEGRACLLTAGYNDRGDLGEQGGVVVTKGPESDRTHILHLVIVQSDQWRRFVAFREALRTTLCEKYARLKRALLGTSRTTETRISQAKLASSNWRRSGP
ncbi:MAG: GrpB family protein [Chloroflexota bacterium]|nr:GrpB family protein [Chloroflexota bacterium]